MANFYMTIGICGSGKTTYVREKFVDAVIISASDVRREVFAGQEDKSQHSKVFIEMERRAIDALNSGKDVVFEATNLGPGQRKRTLDKLPGGTNKHAICFDTPLEVCIEKSKKHEVHPPEIVVREQHAYMIANPPTAWEGWDTISHVIP